MQLVIGLAKVRYDPASQAEMIQLQCINRNEYISYDLNITVIKCKIMLALNRQQLHALIHTHTHTHLYQKHPVRMVYEIN